MPDKTLHLSKDALITKPIHDRAPQVLVGHGNSRAGFELEATEPETFFSWLLETGIGTATEKAVATATDRLKLNPDDARALIRQLVEAGVLTESEASRQVDEQRAEWSKLGWREPADFHLAVRGQQFVPDSSDGSVYRDIYRQILDEPDLAGGQPEHYSPKLTRRAISGIREALPETVITEDVLARAKPVNKFAGPAPDFNAVMAALADAVGVQQVVPGSLGDHQHRSYPSGGARHPFETYVVAKDLPNLETGSYWFDPLTKELHPRLDARVVPEAVDQACFGKGGIVTSHLLLVLTCRWMRHAWKYGYSRSYRMVLLELGHMVQALNLNMRARGIDLYQCPSFSDTKWLELLALDDYAVEGPVYVLGLGTRGRL